MTQKRREIDAIEQKNLRIQSKSQKNIVAIIKRILATKTFIEQKKIKLDIAVARRKSQQDARAIEKMDRDRVEAENALKGILY